MNKNQIISLATVMLVPVFGLTAGEITAEFEGVDDYTDFSVSGLSEEKTLSIFQAELEDELERFSKKYLGEDEFLSLVFTDIDMAGDIQEWRNRYAADIRYIESIFPPRLKFRYTLKDSEGTVLDEGEASITDLSFQMSSIASIKSHYMHFYYETNLLGDWMRRTFRKEKASKSVD